MEAGDLARAMEQCDGAVAIFEHADRRLGEMMPIAAGRNLQAKAGVTDGVVAPGDALLLNAQNVVEFAHVGQEGRAFLRRRDSEARVVFREVDLGQPTIGLPGSS